MNAQLPAHIAIIMDGNGRWAGLRHSPRAEGHRAGVRATREIVEACGKRHVPALTLFAFSSENWYRPRAEVGLLLDLMRSTLNAETRRLAENDVRVQFIGDREGLPKDLVREMVRAETLTRENQGLQLSIALNYGGRWDVAQAARSLARDVEEGRIGAQDIDQTSIGRRMMLAHLPEPDLLIRTGGERRISNYLLWQLAYTELYFTEVLWPDFDSAMLDEALEFYRGRQRRFGRTTEQTVNHQHA